LLALLRLKEARVLDSNDCLLRKVGNELDLLSGEGFNMASVDGNYADHFVSTDQGNAEDCSCPGNLDKLNRGRRLVEIALLLSEI